MTDFSLSSRGLIGLFLVCQILLCQLCQHTTAQRHTSPKNPTTLGGAPLGRYIYIYLTPARHTWHTTIWGLPRARLTIESTAQQNG